MVVLINVFAPQEGVLHKEESTLMKNCSTNLETGTFYITESSIYWINPERKGFAITYDSINAFGISTTQSEDFCKDSLYIVISGWEDENEAAEDDRAMIMGHFQIIPSNRESLQVLFEAMKTGQKLDAADDENYEYAEDKQNGFQGGLSIVDMLGGGDNADIRSDPEGGK